ncbi:type II toxin-antitoxin system VapC family toxin [Endozoicomonas numazuensis]|uniref:Ribonuclease VapC n=1 Tax=Endozoicomonas numazuensis TaxID=1137799 RepID=A0A081NL96_9GAMM|nr:PIN domain nuclease [Endozoicomonas numazuensis]KEQ19219.1 hypothetical protein GZ78_04290 [Endozoicomonas numazuensis]
MDTLVDTSVWIDFFNGNSTPQTACLEELLSCGDACTSPIIIMEVLQGIRNDKQCKKTEQMLLCLTRYPIAEEYYRESAMLYRSLRKRGVTIRKSLDCLIAVTAIQNTLPILHCDRDFRAIAEHSDLITCSFNAH